MSTPQTLTQALPPHQHFDYRQVLLPSPQDRYLPPPRPSSNLSFHGSIPTRPPSNAQLQHGLPPPSRTQSGMSNGYSHGQARAGAEQYGYAGAAAPQQQQSSHDELPRTNGAASLYGRQPPPPPQQVKEEQRALPTEPVHMPAAHGAGQRRPSSPDRKRKKPVDWEQFYGGKPPKEVIVIHDDDSPVPEPQSQQQAPPQTNSGSTTHHVDKRRRMNGGNAELPTYSATNTPYSYSNGASTDSLQATTAPTSLGSNASTSSRLDGAQTGQKRKRTTRTSENERKKQETERTGGRGYLAEYGEYVPPIKQHKKQKDVQVPVLHDV